MADYSKSISSISYNKIADSTKKYAKQTNNKVNANVDRLNKSIDKIDQHRIKKTVSSTLNSMESASKNLARQSAVLVSNTTNLFKTSVEQINKVSFGTLKLATDSMTDIKNKMTEDIHIKKSNTLMLSAAQISPLLGYFLKQAAESGVFDRFKNFAKEKFDNIRNSRSSGGVGGLEGPGGDFDFDEDFDSSPISKSRSKATRKKKKKTIKKSPVKNIVDKAKNVASGSKSTIKSTMAKEGVKSIEALTLKSIDTKLGKIYKVLSESGITVSELKKPKKIESLTPGSKKPWKANLWSAFLAWQRESTLSDLGVDQSTFYQSRFGKDEKKKGIFKSAIRAYKIATDESTLTVQEKMLKALLEMNKSISKQDGVWKLVADRLLIEHATLRTAVWAFKKVKGAVAHLMGYRLYKWATKSRGGYNAKLPRGLGAMEHTAAVLDMLYVDGMWRLDNIVFQLKQQYNLWASYVKSQTGQQFSEPQDVTDKTWRFLTPITKKIKQKYKSWRQANEIPEYQKYQVTTNDLLEKQINIGKTQVRLLTIIAESISATSGYDKRKQIKEASNIEDTYADKRVAEDEYWLSSDENLKKWRASAFFKKKIEAKFGKKDSKIKKLRDKILERESRRGGKQQWKQYKKSGKYSVDKFDQNDELFEAGTDYYTPTFKKWGKGAKSLGKGAWKFAKTVAKDTAGGMAAFGAGVGGVNPETLETIKEVKKQKDKEKAAISDRLTLKMDESVRINKQQLRIDTQQLHHSRKQLTILQKVGGFLKKGLGGVWKIVKNLFVFGFGIVKNLLGGLLTKLGLGGLLGQGVGYAVGRGVRWLGAQAIASPAMAGGVMAVGKGLYDAYGAYKKRKEWGVHGTSAAIGGFLGGSGEGGVASALNGAAKGAGIGMMAFGPLGALVGAAVGGIAGAIGGENLSKAIDFILAPLYKIKDLAIKYVIDPVLAVFKWIGSTVWSMVKGLFHFILHPLDTIKSIGKRINNWIVEKHPWVAKFLGLSHKDLGDKDKKSTAEKAVEAKKKVEEKKKTEATGWMGSLSNWWHSDDIEEKKKTIKDKAQAQYALKKAKAKSLSKSYYKTGGADVGGNKSLLQQGKDWWNSDDVKAKRKVVKDTAVGMYATAKASFKGATSNYRKGAGADRGSQIGVLGKIKTIDSHKSNNYNKLQYNETFKQIQGLNLSVPQIISYLKGAIKTIQRDGIFIDDLNAIHFDKDDLPNLQKIYDTLTKKDIKHVTTSGTLIATAETIGKNISTGVSNFAQSVTNPNSEFSKAHPTMSNIASTAVSTTKSIGSSIAAAGKAVWDSGKNVYENFINNIPTLNSVFVELGKTVQNLIGMLSGKFDKAKGAIKEKLQEYGILKTPNKSDMGDIGDDIAAHYKAPKTMWQRIKGGVGKGLSSLWKSTALYKINDYFNNYHVRHMQGKSDMGAVGDDIAANYKGKSGGLMEQVFGTIGKVFSSGSTSDLSWDNIKEAGSKKFGGAVNSLKKFLGINENTDLSFDEFKRQIAKVSPEDIEKLKKRFKDHPLIQKVLSTVLPHTYKSDMGGVGDDIAAHYKAPKTRGEKILSFLVKMASAPHRINKYFNTYHEKHMPGYSDMGKVGNDIAGKSKEISIPGSVGKLETTKGKQNIFNELGIKRIKGLVYTDKILENLEDFDDLVSDNQNGINSLSPFEKSLYLYLNAEHYMKLVKPNEFHKLMSDKKTARRIIKSALYHYPDPIYYSKEALSNMPSSAEMKLKRSARFWRKRYEYTGSNFNITIKNGKADHKKDKKIDEIASQNTQVNSENVNNVKLKIESKKPKEISIPNSVGKFELIKGKQNVFNELGISKIKGFVYTNEILENLEDFDDLVADNKDGINSLSPFEKSLYMYLNASHYMKLVKPNEFHKLMSDKSTARRIVKSALHHYPDPIYFSQEALNSMSSTAEMKLKRSSKLWRQRYNVGATNADITLKNGKVSSISEQKQQPVMTKDDIAKNHASQKTQEINKLGNHLSESIEHQTKNLEKTTQGLSAVVANTSNQMSKMITTNNTTTQVTNNNQQPSSSKNEYDQNIENILACNLV